VTAVTINGGNGVAEGGVGGGGSGGGDRAHRRGGRVDRFFAP